MKRFKNKITVVLCLLAMSVFLSACGQRLNMEPPPDRVQDAYEY